MSGLYGSPVNVGGFPKTLILTDENGVEVTGVVVGSKTVFTATRDDVKIGKIFASEDGVQEGTDTKTYRVEIGSQYISDNSNFSIVLDDYNMYSYSQFQALIMPYDTSMDNSNAVDKAVINDNVFNAGSNTALSSVLKDDTNKTIDLGITNDDVPHVIRYFVVKEEI